MSDRTESNDSRRYAEMREHLDALCAELEQTHGVCVRGDTQDLDKWTITLRCTAEGSIAAAHAKARTMAKLAEQLGLVKAS